MKELNDLTTDEFVAKNQYTCLLFYLNDSPACQDALELLASMQVRFANVRFGCINVEINAEQAIEHRVRSIPAVVLTKNGQMVFKNEGLVYQDQIHDELVKLRGK